MNGYESILGHAEAIDLLERVTASGRLPQALLFQGPAAVGKATVARIFACALLCERIEDAPCGVCTSCRLVASGGHPDLSRIGLLAKRAAASGDDEGPTASGELRKQVLVDQIRELARVAALAPRVAGRRLFIIDPADQMNGAAQNALLKTLEEPPGETVLILIASRSHLLLPTIRSRCFVVRFAALPTRELADRLSRRGIDGDEALVRASLAEGRPGRALELDPELLRERREEILVTLEQLVASKKALVDLADHAAGLAGKSEATLLEGLAITEALLRDAARAATRKDDPSLVYADLAARLEQLGRRMGAARSALLIDGLERLRSQLRFNLNRTLVAESLLAAVAGGPIP
jgi:DNA polymerase-3 subunit delta'